MPGIAMTSSTGMEWAVHLGLPPIRALPPTFGPPCEAPPCPRFVRRDPSAAPASIFKPPVQQHFNLVVPTSLIERNFDMNFVLQCGLKVVFKRLSRDPSRPSEALKAVHGCVNRHVNPIGFTSYRVTGEQPAGVGAGCSLHGWSVEGGHLVVEVASRQQQQLMQQHISDVQDLAPAPARRLFGDCLPSPATIRKQPPQRDEPSEQPKAQITMWQLGRRHDMQDQQGQLLQPLEQPRQQLLEENNESDATTVTTPPSATQGLITEVQQDVSSSNLTEDVATSPPSSCEQDRFSLPSPASDCSITQDTQEPAHVLSNYMKPAHHSCRPTTRARVLLGVSTPVQRPKRHRRCPTWYSEDMEASAAFTGIDLLLAAHATLAQQETGRPKRLRRPNSLFVH